MPHPADRTFESEGRMWKRKKNQEFTATTVIIHQGLALLHVHTKYNKWLPFGGHVEFGELAHVAALREIKEEAGIDVTLWNPQPQILHTEVAQVVTPMRVLQYSYPPKIIVDFIYFATAHSTELPNVVNEKKNPITKHWFTVDELLQDTPFGSRMPRNVRELCFEAFRVVGAGFSYPYT